MIGWEVVSAVIAILVSLGTVFIAYGRQWAKLSVLIESLSKAVERLTQLADGLAKEQAGFAIDMSKVKSDVESNTRRITGIENRLDRVLVEGFKACSKEGGG